MYGVKPDEKSKFISGLKKDNRNVVSMVGDGINDAAALAESHVGVAIGWGVGAASEVASIVLMGNKISQVNKLFFTFITKTKKMVNDVNALLCS